MGANADVIWQAWEAFGQQDLDGATADMDGDAEVIVPESLPWGGTYRGPDGFKEMVGQFLSQFEDFRPDIEGRFRGRERPGVPLDTWGRSKAGKEMSSRRSGSTGSGTARSCEPRSSPIPPTRSKL